MWHVQLEDSARGFVVAWQGFQKQYTLPAAQALVAGLAEDAKLPPDRLALFDPHRDWSSRTWSGDYARNLAELRPALTALGLSLPEPGTWERHGKWRVLSDRGRPQQLHLVRKLGEAARPDGGYQHFAPVTVFRFVENRWWQDAQQSGAGSIPEALVDGLSGELGDPERVHVFRIHALNLWNAHKGEPPLRDQVRQWMDEDDRLAAQFRQGKVVSLEIR